ncbi:MAG: oligosaccharide flippase family protein [Firmicutes bacterium]|nr:oligosaccharide flippase family protein [Bacillota bacterium]
MGSLFRAVTIIALFAIITRIAGFLFRIYLAQELGAEMLGIYQIAFSVFMVLIVIVSSGLPLAVSKLTAGYRAKGDKKSENKTTTAAFIVGLTVSVFLCGVLFAFQNLFGLLFTDFRCMLILITLLPAVIASAVYAVFRGTLWGQRDYFSVGWTELAEQLLRILFFVIIINFGWLSLDGAMAAGVSLSIACTISAILVFIVYLRHGGKIKPPKGHFGPVLKSAVPVTGVRTVSSLIQPVIALLFPLSLILAGFTNEQALSMFGVAMGMTFPLLFLPGTLTGALAFTLIPELSSAVTQKNTGLIENRIKSAFAFSVFVSMLCVPLFMGLGKEIGVFLYGPENITSGVYLARAAWIMVPLSLANITSSILNSLNLEVKSFIHNIIGGAILLLCVGFLPQFMGVDALILGMGLCMTITTLLNVRMIKKHVPIKLGAIKPIIGMGLIALGCALLSGLLYPLLERIFPAVINLVLSGGIGLAAFIGLCMAFKLADVLTYAVIVTSRFKKKSKGIKQPV